MLFRVVLSTATGPQNIVWTIHGDPTYPRFRTTILALTALAASAVLAVTLLAPSSADAQIPPYKAWGSGVRGGEVVRAFKGTTQVGQVTGTAAGTWNMDIPAGGAANVANGDVLSFTVDGRAAKETVTFAVGQFVAPPGLVLTTSGAAAPTPTPAATPAASVDRGKIAGTPVFDTTGRALAVFNAGSVDELVAEGARNKATGVWAQDASGAFQLYVIGGPAFLGDQFRAKFATGFGVTSVLLVK